MNDFKVVDNILRLSLSVKQEMALEPKGKHITHGIDEKTSQHSIP